MIFAADRLVELGFAKKESEDLAAKVLGNLCQRGYAVQVNTESKEPPAPTSLIYSPQPYDVIRSTSAVALDDPGEIVFTQEGLIAGRVLSETQGWFGKLKYPVFIFLLWLTLGVLFIDIVVVKLINWWPSVWSVIQITWQSIYLVVRK